MNAARPEIVLITRIRTLNKGNQALSSAWLAMLQRAFPAAAIRLIERRPRHVVQYQLRKLAAERDPVAAFERIVGELARLAPGPDLAGPVGTTRILLDERIPPPQKFGAFRQRLNLRGLVARAGLYADEYKRRLSACQRANLVVINPAGEFFPREPQAAFFHLLDAAVAQRLGRPTAIVNHTLDITDPTLRKIIPVLYRSLSLVGFRDGKSVDAFREMGGDLQNVVVTPDLALTTDFPVERARRRRGVIGVTVNAPEALSRGYLGEWDDVIEKLIKADFNIELISNEMPAELAYYDELRRRFPRVKIAGEGLDHDRYAELLSTYELVISSRMHTGILAMVTGTPVVPVEGASFKITALFAELGLPNQVIRPGSPGWTQRVVDEARATQAKRVEASKLCVSKIAEARSQIISTLVPRLQAAAEQRP